MILRYLKVISTLSENQSLEQKKQAVDEMTDKLIQRIVELNTDLPLTTLKDKIGDRIAIVKYKNEAALSEVSNTFSKSIKNYLEKIENLEL